jgi:hypothetical protein
MVLTAPHLIIVIFTRWISHTVIAPVMRAGWIGIVAQEPHLLELVKQLNEFMEPQHGA